MKAAGAPWLLVIVPLVFAAISLPLALEMIGPNAFYGVRTAATRVSEAEWYRINRITGIVGVVAGLCGFAANILIVRWGMASTGQQLACFAVMLGVALLMVASAVVAA